MDSTKTLKYHGSSLYKCDNTSKSSRNTYQGRNENISICPQKHAHGAPNGKLEVCLQAARPSDGACNKKLATILNVINIDQTATIFGWKFSRK